LTREIYWVRYLSDSSYWLYLAHLPLVIGAQAALKDVALPGLVKFLIVTVGVTAILLLSYEYLVRYRWLGRLLNGPRERPSKSAIDLTARGH
jgi:peptidoglycan/LPS O-acetylase OafA/YrhL